MPRKKDGPEKDTRELPCELTHAEFEAKAELLKDVCQSISAKKEERKALTKKLNDAIKAMEEEERQLCEDIDSRTEKRMVACHWVEDYDHNVTRLVRQDTGETVDERALTADDLQGELHVVE